MALAFTTLVALPGVSTDSGTMISDSFTLPGPNSSLVASGLAGVTLLSVELAGSGTTLPSASTRTLPVTSSTIGTDVLVTLVARVALVCLVLVVLRASGETTVSTAVSTTVSDGCVESILFLFVLGIVIIVIYSIYFFIKKTHIQNIIYYI